MTEGHVQKEGGDICSYLQGQPQNIQFFYACSLFLVQQKWVLNNMNIYLFIFNLNIPCHNSVFKLYCGVFFTIIFINWLKQVLMLAMVFVFLNKNKFDIYIYK